MRVPACLLVSAMLLAFPGLTQAGGQSIVLDLAVNPIPNIAKSFSSDSDESDVKTLSGVLEVGEPYLPGAHISYKPPACLLFDYAELHDAKIWAIRVGQKRYRGPKSIYYLRGDSALLSLGVLRATASDRNGWGLLAGIRGGYKVLPFGRILVEPFVATDLVWAKVMEPDINLFVSFGINIGLRLVRPNY